MSLLLHRGHGSPTVLPAVSVPSSLVVLSLDVSSWFGNFSFSSIVIVAPNSLNPGALLLLMVVVTFSSKSAMKTKNVKGGKSIEERMEKRV